MKCNSCGCENNDEARFCKNCGIQLVFEEKKTVIDEIPSEDTEGATTVLTNASENPSELEDDEASTTVLTGVSPVQNAPEGFAPSDTTAPMGFTVVQPDVNEAEHEKPKKKDKKKDKPEGDKPESLGINKAYMVISIVIMVALAGAGAFFYITHTTKIDDLNVEIASLTDANQSYKSENEDKDVLIEDYEEQIDGLNRNVDVAEETIASLKEDIDEYSASSEYYASYNGLIAFSDANTGTSSTTFFASDTVLHMTTEELRVYIYVSETSDLNYYIENSDVASCEWVGWENDNVAVLKVTPGTSVGSTKITLTKSSKKEEASDDEEETSDEGAAAEETAASDETIDIFVYND